MVNNAALRVRNRIDSSLSTGGPICCNEVSCNTLGMYHMPHMPDLRVHRPLLVIGCLAALCGAGPSRAADTAAAADTGGPLQEITVTAPRHEESLSKVPISVTALTQDAMDLRGIKDFQDIVRFTPGVNIDNSGTNNIAIRGIAST